MAGYVMFKRIVAELVEDQTGSFISRFNQLPFHTPVQEDTYKKWLNAIEMDNVQYVQLDEDELEVVKRHFIGIPLSDARVQRFYGDTAKSILYNWPRR